MNNKQTKTPEEVLYQAITDLWPTTLRSWEYLQEETRKIYRHAASAVISHVLQGAKYVLLEVDQFHQQGNECLLDDEGWQPVADHWFGKIVGIGPPCRRPISLPSSVRPEWKIGGLAELYQGEPEGPSTASPASSGDAGVNVPAAWVPKFKVGDCVKWHTESGLTGIIRSIPDPQSDLYGERLLVEWGDRGNTVWELESKLEPIWQLPPPPTGQQWHRADGWTKEMLPEGWRPLLHGERIEPEDQSIWENANVFRAVSASVGHVAGLVWGKNHWFRTRRHLPQSAEPVVVEKSDADPFLQAIRQRDAALEERDQLRKELEKATREVPRLEAELAGCGRQLGDVTRIAREQRERADSLTTENAALKEKLDRWHAVGNSVMKVVTGKEGPLSDSDVEAELTCLRSQFRWTHISERLPTEKDGQEMRGMSGLSFYGMVMWGTKDFANTGHYDRRPEWATHWKHIPLPSSPPETEEQTFETWLLGHMTLRMTHIDEKVDVSRLRAAYEAGELAGKQSTGGPA